jgi:putative sigma-54 modulation protein
MTINFEYDAVSASERLEAFTTKKINKLLTHHDEIVAADVYFKTENTSEEKNGRKCGIRLNVPRNTLFAESSAATFENAISNTVDDLQRQLRKYKEKLRNY